MYILYNGLKINSTILYFSFSLVCTFYCKFAFYVNPKDKINVVVIENKTNATFALSHYYYYLNICFAAKIPMQE